MAILPSPPSKKVKRPSRRRPFASILITLDFSTARLSRAVRESLYPESIGRKGLRSTAEITSRGRTLQIMVEAIDLVALRASVNSFMRFVSAALHSLETLSAFNNDAGDAAKEITH
ncbi:MAG TPA: KEOPS complex subunit Pcc1 [Candidatus Binatus sp.]|nr:KEOPS complex subunit Pcc1 [Candidatus Binatus sp.]